MFRTISMAAIGTGALWISAMGVVALCGELRAEEVQAPAPANTEGVLVLRTGGVLLGRISRDGERYVVDGHKSQLRVPVADVAFAARSLEEAYEVKRGQVGSSAPTAGAHLELSEWCLRQELVSQASQELAAARALEPKHSKLPILERRLAVAMQPPTPRKPPRDLAKSDEMESDLAKSAEELTELRAMARALPDDVVVRFTRKVQPLLVNNCTTSGCHQPAGDEEFQLDRALLHSMGNRRTTLRNLEATLALVDRATPQFSPLLTIPRRAHGGMEAPLMGPRQEQQFEQLVEWVALVTESATPLAIAPAGEPRATKSTEVPKSTVVPATYEEQLASIDAKPTLQYGAKPKPRGPRDPFDPELFNKLAPEASVLAQPAN